jgi:hypothetical protein
MASKASVIEDDGVESDLEPRDTMVRWNHEEVDHNLTEEILQTDSLCNPSHRLDQTPLALACQISGILHHDEHLLRNLLESTKKNGSRSD